MRAYRFVGTYAAIIDRDLELSTFGQRVELPEDVATVAMVGGAALLPEETFDALGFDQDELDALAREPWREPTAEFLEKKQKAIVLYCELRAQVRAAR